MIISHKHKFIFLKSTKTAGTSLEVSLASVCGPKDVITTITKDGLPEDYSHPHKNDKEFQPHLRPESIISKININIWNEYYKILPIRNPWDRMVSYWYWDVNKCKKTYTFSEYIEFKQIHSLLEWYKMPPNSWHTTTSNDKESCADFLIRFEHINEDFSKLCDLLKINPVKLPHAKGNFRTNKKPYQKYYSNKTKEIIANRYHKEIELIGYSFNDKSE